MQAERWQQIERLFHSALQRAPDERAALLDEACASDAELRREVESLLAEHARGGSLLETAAADLAADWAQDHKPATVAQTLGHFRILSLLGKGGMGEVYLAEDLKLHRKVALKLLPAEVTEHEARLRRFEQEARAASALNHPNIITIYEIGEAEETRFIATEYIEGQTLRAPLKQGALPLETVLDVAVQVASALAAAHEAGILHRDIKPENIMRRPDGLVKVLDFGLAKLIRPQPDLRATMTSNAVQTTPGMVMGTLAYMSPEQAQGLEVDTRTDIFSLGAVLYEMVTGKRAFRGDSQMALLAALIEREPEPLPARVPPDLAKVILRCLRKEPARRYQTAADLKVALEDLREETAASRQVHARARRRWTRAALPALLALLLGAGFFAWQRWRAPESREPLHAIPLTTLRGVQRHPSFSPEGNRVAFTWTGPKQDNSDIYVQQVGASTPLRLTTNPSNDYNPVWSPDDRWIAFLRSQTEAGKNELRLITPLGGPERKLAEIRVRDGLNVIPPYLAWCPDSTCLVVTDSPGEGQPDALFVISLDGEKKQLTHPPPGAGDSNPAVSPDSRWLVFRRNTGGLFTGALYGLALGAGLSAVGEPRRLTQPVLDAAYPTWLPDSKEILFAPPMGGLRRLVVAGENTPQRLPFVGEDGTMAVVSRPQPGRPARLVYVRMFQDWNIWRIETAAPGAAASSSAVSIASTRMDGMPQLSPDSSRVAFWSVRSGENEIWLADPGGTNPVQLTFMGAGVRGYPHWSPNGQMIVFHSALEGQWEVYVIPAAGGKPRNLTAHPANDVAPSFSRDGQWIYFNSNRTKEGQLWKIPATGGEAVLVTNGPGYMPQESPDGAYLYYVQAMDGPCPAWRVPTSGGEPVKVVDGVVLGNFVVLKQGIYYITRSLGEGGRHYFDRPSGETRLQYFDFATRRTTTVAGNLGDIDMPLTASSDGRLILYNRLDFSVDDLMLVENFR
jgi:eukaryotic-like serine/threonine-protein kinase